MSVFTSGPAPKRGRPSFDAEAKRIRLRPEVFDCWTNTKEDLGLSHTRHSQFAEYLLGICKEHHAVCGHPSSPANSLKVADTPNLTMSSTPKTKGRPAPTMVEVSPILEESMDMPVDITGVSSIGANTTLIDVVHSTINAEFGTYEGDLSSESDSEFESSDPSCSESWSNSSSLFDAQSDEELILNDSISESWSTSSSLFDAQGDEDSICDDSSSESWTNSSSSFHVQSNLVCDDRFSDKLEDTLSASECEAENTSDHIEVDMDVSVDESIGMIEVQHGPVTKEERNDILKEKLETKLSMLNKVNKEHEVYLGLFNKVRVITDIDLLLTLFNGGCRQDLCSGSSKVIGWRVEAGCCHILWKCSNGHNGSWSSSPVLCNKGGQDVYANSLLMAISTLITGSSFDKLQLFCKFLHLNMISRSTYMRMQRNYMVPGIRSFWEDMRKEIWEILNNEPVILCGDGRNDSPGFSSKYCVYILMEQFLHVIVAMDVIDKRETGGISTKMEVFGLKRLLERIVGKIVTSEIVTDASTSVIALVRKMKDKYPKEYGDLFHSLDIWHKSVKLTTKLTKAAKVKNCELINQWIEPIRNHFWHVAENCRGDEEALKDSWFGVVHHVAGEHEWADGECYHGPLVETESGKTVLDKGSKALQSIRIVVLDPRFLSSLNHYVYFRHTSRLENFNSMLLKYTPKRVGFQNDAFIARTQLAVIDHNSHIFRKPALTKSGKKRHSKIYSKRSKNWKITTVMQDKTYEYWENLACRIVDMRVKDKKTINRRVTVPSNHPSKISKSIAMKPIPQTDELVRNALSRFEKS